MDIVERLRSIDISWSEHGEWCAEAADVIEKLRETNIMQTRWLYEAQQENKLFKEKVRQWLNEGKPTAMEGE